MTNENQTNELETLRQLQTDTAEALDARTTELAEARQLIEQQEDELRALRELVEERAEAVVLVRTERDAAVEDIRTARALMAQQKASSEIARKLLDASVARQPIEDLIDELESNGGSMLASKLREAIDRADNPREFIKLVG